VLALAGAMKLRTPEATVGALAAAGIRVPSPAVRALGAGELALAAACALRPSTATGLALAIVYLAFAAFVAAGLRRGDAAPCGCFGDASARLTGWHLALDLAASAIAIATALAPPSWDAVSPGALPAAALALGVAACVYLVHAAYTTLPAAAWAPRDGGRTGGSRWDR
jgi:methylamine utilization protein MauE